jgi:hypothetical protein
LKNEYLTLGDLKKAVNKYSTLPDSCPILIKIKSNSNSYSFVHPDSICLFDESFTLTGVPIETTTLDFNPHITDRRKTKK